MDDLDQTIKNILKDLPEKISPPDLAVLMANIVNIYGFAHLWPMVALQITDLINEHETTCEAVDDADDFLNRITKGKMH